MKKKGFTLIELLAVIVILAVIALIATPTILGVIETAQKGSFEQTINGIVNSAEIYRAQIEITDPISDCRYFSFNNDVAEKSTINGKVYYPTKDLELKGEVPTKGEVEICKETITLKVGNEKYAGIYDGKKVTVTIGDLSDMDTIPPIIDNISASTTTNKIRIIVNAHSESVGGIVEKYYYKINEEEYIESTSNVYEFDKIGNNTLNPNTEYTIIVKVKNKSGLESEIKTKTVKTGTTNITYEETQTPENMEYAETKTVKVTYTATNVAEPAYYVKTSVNTKSDIEGLVCGIETDPTDCETTKTKDFVANTWYKVEINPTITFEENGTVFAQISDGEIYSSASTHEVDKIDITDPSVEVTGVDQTTTSITINYNSDDAESKVKETICEYGIDNTYGKKVIGTNGKCEITGINSNTKYYYQVCSIDNAGNTICKDGESITNMEIFNYKSSDEQLIGNIYRAGFTHNPNIDNELVSNDTRVDKNGYWSLVSSYSGTSLYAYGLNSIDVTNLKKIKFNISLARNGNSDYEFSANLKFGLTSVKDELNSDFDILETLYLAKEETSQSIQTIYMDVSELEGNKYFKFILHHGEEITAYTCFAYIYNIEGIYY